MSINKKTKFPIPFYYLIFKINSIDNPKFRNLFTEVKSEFENIPVIRWAGWDIKLSTGSKYSIDLEGIEYMDSIKRVRISENGGFLIQGSLSDKFLCWRGGEMWEENSTYSKIHSLALIEFTYNSFVGLQKLLNYVDNPISVNSEIGFEGIDETFSLRFNKIGSGYISFEESFKNSGDTFGLELSALDLSEEKLPETVFIAIEKIYRMFGVDPSKIPYSTDLHGKKIIDINSIKGAK